jgi:hypothetical protein
MEWYKPRCRCMENAGEDQLPNQEDVLPGGEGDSLSVHDVDDAQLGKGIKVEMEHTDDLGKAVEIALDHLAEDPEYYSRLELVHKD